MVKQCLELFLIGTCFTHLFPPAVFSPSSPIVGLPETPSTSEPATVTTPPHQSTPAHRGMSFLAWVYLPQSWGKQFATAAATLLDATSGSVLYLHSDCNAAKVWNFWLNISIRKGYHSSFMLCTVLPLLSAIIVPSFCVHTIIALVSYIILPNPVIFAS